jgi:hypothetical protein
MGNIVVINDFSEISVNGLALAGQIAKITGSKVYILNDIHFSDFLKSEDKLLDMEFQSSHIQDRPEGLKFKNIMNSAFTDEIETEQVIIKENFIENIKSIIENIKAELLITGVHLYEDFNSDLYPHKVEEAVKDITCPVIIVNHTDNLERIHNLGVMFYRFDQDELSKLGWIKEFGENLHAKIHLFGIAGQIIKDNLDVIRKLENIATEYAPDSISVNTVIYSDLIDGLKFFLKKNNIDFFVLLSKPASRNIVSEIISEILTDAPDLFYCQM